MEFNGDVAKLTINDAYTEDTGDYSVEVWNELGSQTAPFKITIKGRNFKIFKRFIFNFKVKKQFFQKTKKASQKDRDQCPRRLT